MAQPATGQQEPSEPPVQQPPEGEELSAREIADRALDTTTLGFQDGEFQIAMFIREESGHERERFMNLRSRSEDDISQSLIRLLAPAELAGQSYLFLDNAEGDDEIWMLLPALEDAPRRIAGSQRNDGFLGSNFSYADLEARDIRDGQVTRLPDEELAGFAVYIIVAVREGSPYSSVRLWARQSDFVPLRVRYFAGDGSTEKTLFTEQISEHQGRVYIRRSSMVARDESATTMVVESLDYEAEISPAEFTLENLVRR